MHDKLTLNRTAIAGAAIDHLTRAISVLAILVAVGAMLARHV